MRPNERRQAIIETLCARRHETMKNLAMEFGVSVRTICYDIEILSLTYPITTVQGKYGGGVYVSPGYRLGNRYLSSSQQALLERLLEPLQGEDKIILQSILKDFALKK